MQVKQNLSTSTSEPENRAIVIVVHQYSTLVYVCAAEIHSME